jgi:integrase
VKKGGRLTERHRPRHRRRLFDARSAYLVCRRRYELIGATAHSLLDSIERGASEDERADAPARQMFEDGFRFGLGIALQSLAYRLTGTELNPGWTVSADRLRTAIARACRAAGVPAFSPHGLRHRRISLLHRQRGERGLRSVSSSGSGSCP